MSPHQKYRQLISAKSRANETWREAISETHTLNSSRTRSRSKETILQDLPTFEEFIANMATTKTSVAEIGNFETQKSFNSELNNFPKNKPVESHSQKVIEISGPSRLVSLNKSLKKSSSKKRSSNRKTIEIDNSKHKSILQGRDSMLTVTGMASWKKILNRNVRQKRIV